MTGGDRVPGHVIIPTAHATEPLPPSQRSPSFKVPHQKNEFDFIGVDERVGSWRARAIAQDSTTKAS